MTSSSTQNFPFETCYLSLRLTSLGCFDLTKKTTRQTNFNELVPASTPFVLWWSHDAKKLSSLVSASATHVTQAHLLRGDPPPACEYCRRPLSICHLLITCPCYVPIRLRYYRSTNLTHLLTHVQPSRIFSFLTEIKLFDQLCVYIHVNTICSETYLSSIADVVLIN